MGKGSRFYHQQKVRCAPRMFLLNAYLSERYKNILGTSTLLVMVRFGGINGNLDEAINFMT